MQKTVVILASTCLCLVLGGCGTSSKLADIMQNQPPTKQTANADGSVTTFYAPGEFLQSMQLDLQRDCRQWQMEQAEADRVERQAIANAALSDGVSDIKMAFYSLKEIHHDTMDYLKSRDGAYQQDICKPGTNQWDAYIAEVQENGRTFRQYSSDGSSFGSTLVKWVSGVFAVTKISENGGDTVGGDKVEAGRNAQYAQGDATQTPTQDISEVHQSGVNYSTLNADQNKNPSELSEESEEGLLENDEWTVINGEQISIESAREQGLL